MTESWITEWLFDVASYITPIMLTFIICYIAKRRLTYYCEVRHVRVSGL